MKFRILAVIVFVAAIAAGYFGRSYLEERVVPAGLLPQSGWCCMDQTSTCVAAHTSAGCFAEGGSLFDTHKDVCERACAPLQ